MQTNSRQNLAPAFDYPYYMKCTLETNAHTKRTPYATFSPYKFDCSLNISLLHFAPIPPPIWHTPQSALFRRSINPSLPSQNKNATREKETNASRPIITTICQNKINLSTPPYELHARTLAKSDRKCKQTSRT